MAQYSLVACHVLWRELCHYAAQSRNCFQFHFLKRGLHNEPDQLRIELQAAVDAVEPESEAILLGYGLCSNGLVGIEARDRRLVVMRGHDCITFLLGSKERYRAYFDGHPGAYWYSPGWIDTNDQPSMKRYERTLAQYTETYGEDNAKYLMEATEGWIRNYNTAAYVDLGVGDTAACKAFTRTCAGELGWQCDILEGDPRLIRDFLDGRWESEDFLVVEPGERIVASHDDGIIATEKAGANG